jgi:crotonobetainyl-CoA:carnitine CoA-transferase CaiB-like acyl-CoA transferase
MQVGQENYKATGIPVKLSRSPGAVRTPPKPKGTDTRAVLASLGYDAAAIDRLLADRAAL